MTTMTEYEKATEAARKAQERAENARRKAEQAEVAHHAAVEARRQENAQATIDSFDEAALNQGVKQAERALRQVLASDPMWQALGQVYAAWLRKANGHMAAVSAAARLQVSSPAVPYTAAPVSIDELLRMTEVAAAAGVADEQDALDEAAERYAQTGERD